MNEQQKFELQVIENINGIGADRDLQQASLDWLTRTLQHKYSYNFTFLGRPIIQYPQDMVAMQELIWKIKPDLIIETGIAHGGSLIMSAAILSLIDYCEAMEAGTALDPRAATRKVLAVDIDIRKHNREAIEQHPMSHRIQMIQGSSIDADIIAQVHEIGEGFERILVCLDSNHTHQHVLAELNAYASLVSLESYCVVFDTIIEDLPADMFPDRPWGPGENPKTAVWEFMNSHPEFEIDKNIDQKLLISVAPDGFLKRIQ